MCTENNKIITPSDLCNLVEAFNIDLWIYTGAYIGLFLILSIILGSAMSIRSKNKTTSNSNKKCYDEIGRDTSIVLFIGTLWFASIIYILGGIANM